jgi:hypothetical protein
MAERRAVVLNARSLKDGMANVPVGTVDRADDL